MIYIDPPYNTGNDFIYADDFMRAQEEENEQMGMYDEDENRLVQEYRHQRTLSFRLVQYDLFQTDAGEKSSDG